VDNRYLHVLDITILLRVLHTNSFVIHADYTIQDYSESIFDFWIAQLITYSDDKFYILELHFKVSYIFLLRNWWRNW